MFKSHFAKILIFLCVLISSIFIAGCSNVIPDMTGEEQDLIVEYAASKLLQYDTKVGSQFNKEYPETIVEDEEGESTEIMPEDETENDLEMPSVEVTQTPVVVEPEEEILSFEETLGLEGISVLYTGFEAVKFYPDNGDEIYFVMNATEGNELIIVHFLVENKTQDDKEIAFTHNDTRFKLVMDGESRNVLTTLLLNDLSSYVGTLNAGESLDLVLVGEYPEGTAASAESMEVSAFGANGTTKLKMK